MIITSTSLAATARPFAIEPNTKATRMRSRVGASASARTAASPEVLRRMLAISSNTGQLRFAL